MAPKIKQYGQIKYSLNYIAVDIAEALLSYPSQHDIDIIEKLLNRYFSRLDQFSYKTSSTIPTRSNRHE